MYIFGYLFQKWDFKGSSKKRAHRQKTFFLGGATSPALFFKSFNNFKILNVPF